MLGRLSKSIGSIPRLSYSLSARWESTFVEKNMLFSPVDQFFPGNSREGIRISMPGKRNYQRIRRDHFPLACENQSL